MSLAVALPLPACLHPLRWLAVVRKFETCLRDRHLLGRGEQVACRARAVIPGALSSSTGSWNDACDPFEPSAFRASRVCAEKELNCRRRLFSATLCCVLNSLSDFGWPPKYLRSRERHANRGWKSWVHMLVWAVPDQGLVAESGRDQPKVRFRCHRSAVDHPKVNE